MTIKTYTRKQYIELAKITEYEFNKRLRNKELQKLGEGKATLYCVTQKHTAVLIDNLKTDLRADKCCGGKCHNEKAESLKPGYGAKETLAVPDERLLDLLNDEPKRPWYTKFGRK